MRFKAEILVTLREGVHDPQGAAIDTVLKRTGLEENAEVRTGKLFTVKVTADEESGVKEKVVKICEEVLLNPILENYKIERLEQL